MRRENRVDLFGNPIEPPADLPGCEPVETYRYVQHDYYPSAQRRLTFGAALAALAFLFFAIGWMTAKAEGSHDHGRIIGKERTAPEWRPR